MAHTKEYWYDQILAEKARQPSLNGITSTSKVSIFGSLAFTFAFTAWLLEALWDAFVAEVRVLLSKERAHQEQWYREQALAFQYGQTFNRDLGKYENVGLTAAQIAAQKIIQQAAVTEVNTTNNVGLRIKIAIMISGVLAPPDAAQLAAFTAYMQKVKDAGVKLIIDGLPPDALKLDLDIFYDPLVLDSNGARIDGTNNTSVQDAIDDYLSNPLTLPFNGEYANTRLTDEMQKVEGVKLPVIKTAWAKFGAFPFAVIDEKYIPDAGYIRLNRADLTIRWRPYV